MRTSRRPDHPSVHDFNVSAGPGTRCGTITSDAHEMRQYYAATGSQTRPTSTPTTCPRAGRFVSRLGLERHVPGVRALLGSSSWNFGAWGQDRPVPNSEKYETRPGTGRTGNLKPLIPPSPALRLHGQPCSEPGSPFEPAAATDVFYRKPAGRTDRPPQPGAPALAPPGLGGRQRDPHPVGAGGPAPELEGGRDRSQATISVHRLGHRSHAYAPWTRHHAHAEPDPPVRLHPDPGKPQAGYPDALTLRSRPGRGSSWFMAFSTACWASSGHDLGIEWAPPTPWSRSAIGGS